MFEEKTEAYCNTCKCNHPAQLYEVDNKILAGFDCPENGTNSYEISTDAELYKKIRMQCFLEVTKASHESIKPHLNIIPITDACNFKCVACGMNAKPRDNANYLSIEEIIKRADLIKADGGKFVNLFGGEPTLHPRLFEILERLRPYKFNIAVVTNGLIVGTDPDFAKKLKKRGLSRISIQFDTLNNETLKKFGRSHLKEKLQAIKYSLDASLNVGLNCLVTKDNLHEMPELIQFAADQPANLFMMAFLSCAPIGHLAIDHDKLVGREEMIKTILGNYNGFSIDVSDFSPLITYLPWRIEGHPDCGAGLLFVKNNGKATPLSYYFDLNKLWEMAARNRMSPGFLSKNIIPLIYLASCIKKGRRLKILSLVGKFLMNQKSIGLMNIGTTNYKASEFQDMNRVSRCNATIYTSQGPVKGCNYFFRDETFPGSRLSEQKRDVI